MLRGIASSPHDLQPIFDAILDSATLVVPLLKGDEVVRIIARARKQVQPFTDRQISLFIEAHGERLRAIPCEPQGALFQFTIPAD